MHTLTYHGIHENLKASLNRGLVCTVNIGSSKILSIVAKVCNNSSEFIYHHNHYHGNMIKIIGFGQIGSSGISGTQGIVDIDKATQSLRAALDTAERQANRTINHVIITGSTFALESMMVNIRLSMSDPKIDKLLHSITNRKHYTTVDKYPLHAFPVNVIDINGKCTAFDPSVHLQGSEEKIRLYTHIQAISSMQVASLSDYMQRSDLQVAGILDSAYASGLACLTDTEKKNGAICIDMGGDTTGISLFYHGHCIASKSIPLGGKHITKDISQAFSLSFKVSERLKTIYGDIATVASDHDEILDTESTTDITRSALIGVIRPRLEETFEFVREYLESVQFTDISNRIIVITGGACQLPGVPDIAHRILGYPVQLRTASSIPSINKINLSDPSITCAIGGIIHACSNNTDLRYYVYKNREKSRAIHQINQLMKWLYDTW